MCGPSGPGRCWGRSFEKIVEVAFADGLQEIEGWLDFGQAAEDLEAPEHDVWSGGTIVKEAERQEAFSTVSWRLVDFVEQAATLKSL